MHPGVVVAGEASGWGGNSFHLKSFF
jgi:hypothetical protein